MANRDVVQEVHEAVDALVRAGIASASDIRGCSAEEVDSVLAKALPLHLPVHYVAFLRILGNGAGRLFRGTDIFYPNPLEADAVARDLEEENDVDLAVNRRFFFAHHQGYQAYFFEPGSPAVFMYTEGDEKPRKLADDFLEYLWAKVNAERAVS